MQVINYLDGNIVSIEPTNSYLLIKYKNNKIKIHINDLQFNIQRAKMKQIIEISEFLKFENKHN